MQFSLADIGIPQGATIESVKLFIGIASKDTSSGGSVPRDMEIGLYGLTQNFTPGSVTWDNASKDDPWQTAGGVFDASPLDTEVINSGDGAPGNYVFSSASLTALVQQSLDSRDDLIDLILKLTTEATGTTDREVFRFGLKNSLDGNVATYVPRLEITFAQVPEPSTVALMIAVPVLGLALLRRRSRR